jgi:hypothetical protein
MRKYAIIKLALFLLIIGLIVPQATQAQWPPFRFELIPSHESGKLTYRVEFRNRTDWLMTNLTLKLPLPEGTRFLEAHSTPDIEVGFDGKEITVFMAVVDRQLEQADVSIILEITDPAATIFTGHPWITWQGKQPGDFLPDPVSIDITRTAIDWAAPTSSRLQLSMSATVANNVITYYIFTRNVGGRMWDLKVNVPVPAGTTFLAAEPAPDFVANYDGHEVSFFTLEIPRGKRMPPLVLKVERDPASSSLIKTRAWATWKNTGRRVGLTTAAQEEFTGGDLVVSPFGSPYVAADSVGDVFMANYDITSVGLEEVMLPDDELGLKANFFLAGPLDAPGLPLRYSLYLDNDCNNATGERRGDLGVEYWIKYKHDTADSNLSTWNAETETWDRVKSVRTPLRIGAEGQLLTFWIPYRALQDGRQFCWFAEARNLSKEFENPPIEVVPGDNSLLSSHYQLVEPAVELKDEEISVFTGQGDPAPLLIQEAAIGAGDVWKFLPGQSELPTHWQQPDFDDTGWFAGQAGLGYGHPALGTDLSISTNTYLTSTAGIPTAGGLPVSLLLRHAFNVADPTLIKGLTLSVNFKGGFIAYLNGHEIARQGLAAGEIAFDQTAADSDGTILTEAIDLTPHVSSLVKAGANVLAIQAHRAAGSATLYISPELTWFRPASGITAEALPPQPATTTPASNEITGKLAVPIDNGRVGYDVHIFSMPDGQELLSIQNARQPNLRFDGQQMLINREGNGVENVFEYDLTHNTERQVTASPTDWHPFYDPWGNRVVYGNADLVLSGIPVPVYENGEVKRHDKTNKIIYTSERRPFIFVQCGLMPPQLETEPRCQDIPSLGVLVPAGHIGEIQGTHPVWTSNDMIAYKGCNSWSGFGACGIYLVPSSSTKGFSNGFIPRKLSTDTSDTPSDTKGQLIAFTTQRDGDWEAYIMDLNGANVQNLSNSPESNDGLPTISPDGYWVAFVSDRGGPWAVWVAPVTGGPAQKLFDLPTNMPWVNNDSLSWLNERISWGLE